MRAKRKLVTKNVYLALVTLLGCAFLVVYGAWRQCNIGLPIQENAWQILLHGGPRCSLAQTKAYLLSRDNWPFWGFALSMTLGSFWMIYKDLRNGDPRP